MKYYFVDCSSLKQRNFNSRLKNYFLHLALVYITNLTNEMHVLLCQSFHVNFVVQFLHDSDEHEALQEVVFILPEVRRKQRHSSYRALAFSLNKKKFDNYNAMKIYHKYFGLKKSNNFFRSWSRTGVGNFSS